MATISISLTGSSIIANSTKNYTISDADLQSLLTCMASRFSGYIQTTFNTSTPTNQQILLAWLQNRLIAETVADIQGFQRVTPPAIVIT